MNVDDVHFVSKKQKAQFKLKAQVDSFIANTRAVEREVNNLLKQMKFKMSFSWSYDPLWNISSIRVAKKSTPYVHVEKPKIEQYANKVEWERNIL